MSPTSAFPRRPAVLRAMVPCMAAVLLLAGCGNSDDDATDGATTTTTTTTTTASSDGGSADTSETTIAGAMTVDELADELAVVAETGDICQFDVTMATAAGIETSSGSDYRQLITVISPALRTLAGKNPGETGDALTALAAQGDEVVAELEANGDNLDDPALADIQQSPKYAEAQTTYTQYLQSNCGVPAPAE